MELADQVESHLSLQIDVDDGRVRDVLGEQRFGLADRRARPRDDDAQVLQNQLHCVRDVPGVSSIRRTRVPLSDGLSRLVSADMNWLPSGVAGNTRPGRGQRSQYFAWNCLLRMSWDQDSSAK